MSFGLRKKGEETLEGENKSMNSAARRNHVSRPITSVAVQFNCKSKGKGFPSRPRSGLFTPSANIAPVDGWNKEFQGWVFGFSSLHTQRPRVGAVRGGKRREKGQAAGRREDQPR